MRKEVVTVYRKDGTVKKTLCDMFDTIEEAVQALGEEAVLDAVNEIVKQHAKVRMRRRTSIHKLLKNAPPEVFEKVEGYAKSLIEELNKE